MTLHAQIAFSLLVLINIATLLKLGRPWKYRERDVALWMVASSWSLLLADGLFLLAVFGFAHGRWAEYALLAFLDLRVVVQAWLFWMILRDRRR